MLQLWKIVHGLIWALAMALPRQIAMLLLLAMSGAAVCGWLWLEIEPLHAAGFVTESLASGAQSELVGLAPLPFGLWPFETSKVILPADAMLALAGETVPWIVGSGSEVKTLGSHEALWVEVERVLPFDTVIALGRMLPDPTPMQALALAFAALVGSRLVLAVAASGLGGALIGTAAWTALAIADHRAVLIAPGATALFLASLPASFAAAMCFRIVWSGPDGLVGRVMAATGIALLVPLLVEAEPLLRGYGAAVALAGLVMPGLLPALIAGLAAHWALSPTGLAGVLVLAGAAIFLPALRALVQPPAFVTRRRARAATVPPSDAPPAATPGAGFDWSELLNGPKP